MNVAGAATFQVSSTFGKMLQTGLKKKTSTWIYYENAWKKSNKSSQMVVWWWFTMVQSIRNHLTQIRVKHAFFCPISFWTLLARWHVLFWGPETTQIPRIAYIFFSPNNKWDLQTNRLPSQKPFEKLRNHHYLVVSTTLEKNASQIGSFPQEGVKINNIPPISSTRVFNLQWLFSWFPRPSRPKFVQLGISSLNIFWVFFGSANC